MNEPPFCERDPIRADLFSALQSLSEVIPEMRAGQLMAAVEELCADLHRPQRGQPQEAASEALTTGLKEASYRGSK